MDTYGHTMYTGIIDSQTSLSCTTLYNLSHPLIRTPCDTIYTEVINSDVETIRHKLSVYPNPTTNYLTFKLSESDVSVAVVNPLGMVQYPQQRIVGSDKTISTADWPEGVYFVRFSKGGKTLHTEKVVVIK